ncbi:MAG: hypothetical protein FWD26_10195 [Treponema sp.]|nr:hypothetical protein [Treponema sp.]
MVKAIKNYNCTLPLRLVTENKSINLTDDLIFAGLDTAITNTDNSEIWANFGKKAAVSAVTTLMGAGVGAAAEGVGNVVLKGVITTVGTYTTTVAADYMNAIDFRTGEFDREAAQKSLYSASTIAGALGAGLTTGLNEYIKIDENVKFSNDFFASAAKLGVSLAGEALQYGTHVIYNLASGQGKDSFGNAFDDMGGLTFNLLNLSTIASLFGADDKTASDMKLGLFELQITRDGVSSRIGTNGIDVSGLVYSFASWGGEMLRNAAARNAAERTELAGRMAEPSELELI